MNEDKELEKAIKDVSEIVDLCEDDIKNNNNNVTATLGLEDLKSLQIILRELKNSIPKKKVENEIEILKAQCGGNPYHIQQTLNAEIRLLQELLEDK